MSINFRNISKLSNYMPQIQRVLESWENSKDTASSATKQNREERLLTFLKTVEFTTEQKNDIESIIECEIGKLNEAYKHTADELKNMTAGDILNRLAVGHFVNPTKGTKPVGNVEFKSNQNTRIKPCVGCAERRKSASQPVSSQIADIKATDMLPDRLSFPRQGCAECVLKHISEAGVALMESKLGYPEYRGWAVGFMSHAEQEAFSLSPDFANCIRTERIKIIRSSEYVPDFNQMIKTAMSLLTESGRISNEKHAQSIENKAFKKENINRLDTGGKQ